MAQSPLFSRKQPGGVFTIVDIQDHAGDAIIWTLFYLPLEAGAAVAAAA